MSPRRSKLDIILKVLSSVKNGVDKPTRIMYASNMSWKPTQQILANLVSQGFLSEMQILGKGRPKMRYEITEKGNNVLDYFSGAEKLLKIV